MTDDSLATGLRSLGPARPTVPLEPPPTAGCPATSGTAIQYPLEVTYDLEAVDPVLFERPIRAGLERWAPLLPPLVPGIGIGAGGTPLVDSGALVDEWGLEELLAGPTRSDGEGGSEGRGSTRDGESTAAPSTADLFLKDESRNPTWSHKDRLARTVVSAAVRADAAGLVVSSSGNHGAATAAHAARAGLPCVVLTSPRTPPAMQAFVRQYGATVLAVRDGEARREAVDRLAADHDFHPASTRTPVHTGHPWGPEGYTTIAYELLAQLGGRPPGTVAVPTCFAELLYGIWKGFRTMETLGVIGESPTMVACEPGVRAPLVEALRTGEPVATVEPAETEAYSIKAVTSSVRGRRAVEESDGIAIGVPESDIERARVDLARSGCWQEVSGAAGMGGLVTLAGDEPDEHAVDASGKPVTDPSLPTPVVAVGTASGFKDGRRFEAPVVEGDPAAIENALVEAGVLGG